MSDFKVGDVVVVVAGDYKYRVGAVEKIESNRYFVSLGRDTINDYHSKSLILYSEFAREIASKDNPARAGEPETPNHIPDAGKMVDPNVLHEADAIAGKDRAEAYGHPYDNHKRIALLWQAYMESRKAGPLTPSDVARMMILLKVARDLHSPKRDNKVDAAGYVRCLELIEEREAGK